MIRLTKTETAAEWLSSPQTEKVFRELNELQEQRFKVLLQACERTMDANVARAHKDYMVLSDVLDAMKGMRKNG